MENGFHHLLANRDLPHQALKRHQLSWPEHGLGLSLVTARRRIQHPPLGELIGVIDIDLQQKAVELGLGQRIGTLLLQRVLGRQHMERRGHIIAHPRHRDVMLLHRLQQRRLGLGAGAIDLVSHQQLGKHRPFHEPEAATAAGCFIQHLGANDVRRHQVRCELDALAVSAEDRAQRLNELGLAQARHADQERMTSGKQRHQRLLDDGVLAKNHSRRRLLGAPHGIASSLDAGNDSLISLIERGHRTEYRGVDWDGTMTFLLAPGDSRSGSRPPATPDAVMVATEWAAAVYCWPAQKCETKAVAT